MDLFRENEWAVTFTGEPPTRGQMYYIAGSYEDALDFGRQVAERDGHNVNDLTVFYRIRVTATSQWAKVGHTTDYSEEFARARADLTQGAKEAIIQDLA